MELHSLRVATAQIDPVIGDLEGNFHRIRQGILEAREQGAQIIVFPELAMTGYPPEDFLLQDHFVAACEHLCLQLAPDTKGMVVAVGTVRHDGGEKKVHNSAALFRDGAFVGYADKVLLPTYDVFDEARYFSVGGPPAIFEWQGLKIGISICEDIWMHAGRVQTRYARDPVRELAALEPDLVLNLSASPFELGKSATRHEVILQAAKTLGCPVVYCNQVGAQDMLIFDGRSQVVDPSRGALLMAPAFQRSVNTVSLSDPAIQIVPMSRGQELRHALVLGIRDYFEKQSIPLAILGVSGGIDSAVVLALAAEALGPQRVEAVFMPSHVTGELSRQCVDDLLRSIPAHRRDYPIEGIVRTFEDVLGPNSAGVTRENLQARVRGTLLMAVANETGGIVLATGNKSELAMGYCTLYGDMAGGLAVLADVPKVLVYELARAYNEDGRVIPEAIIERPPTAELRAGQLDSDSLPPYAIIDTVVGEYLEHNLSAAQIASLHSISLPLVQQIISRIHRNEFKRRQAPPGLRVTSKAFLVGRKFPIVQRFVV
jgi:NAD+ synthase (glutamine-hydrolysing)